MKTDETGFDSDLTATPITFIDSDEFSKRNAAGKILAEAPCGTAERNVRASANEIGQYLGTTCRLPLMTQAEETYYFRRMNFLKRRAEMVRRSLPRTRRSARKLKQISDDLHLATQDMQRLVRHNLRLVLPLAQKARKLGLSFWDAVSEGNTSLLRAVQGFDYSRGFRFSTYATWAIRRSMFTLAQKRGRERQRFVNTETSVYTEPADVRESVTAENIRHERMQAMIRELLQHLDKRSQKVLILRYGLGDEQEPMTLRDVGEKFGVSKERVRQIESKALQHLRRLSGDSADMDFAPVSHSMLAS